MSRSTTRISSLAIGCQYEDREKGLIAYIDCAPMQPTEIIRYRLRPTVKRNAIATDQLRQEFSEWLETYNA